MRLVSNTAIEAPSYPAPLLRRGGLSPIHERRAKARLTADLQADTRLDDLARECGLSKRHFLRAFKTSTGEPPHRWLLGRRIDRAKELLVGSALELSEIANLCGFSDQSHFNRMFRRMTGETPGGWRRAHRS